MPSRTPCFAKAPLTTPERLRSEWREILAIENLPPWVRGIVPVHADPDDETQQGCPTDVVVVLGTAGKRQREFKFSTLGFAICLEICRLGHSCGTNANSSRPPLYYAQFIFAGDGWNSNESVARVLNDAGPGEVARSTHRRNDLTAEGSYREDGPRATRPAREVAFANVKRAFEERGGDGLPEGVGFDAYHANLLTLFDHYDMLPGRQVEGLERQQFGITQEVGRGV